MGAIIDVLSWLCLLGGGFFVLAGGDSHGQHHISILNEIVVEGIVLTVVLMLRQSYRERMVLRYKACV